MNRLLGFMYLGSVLIVMLGFYGMNFFTETIVDGGTGGGNGNPALFILVFLMPFLFYFLYGTIELSMWLVKTFKEKSPLRISLMLSGGIAFSIIVYTFFKAQALRYEITEKLENFDEISQIGLLNTFSNAVFFNPLTFILLLLICYLIGAGWTTLSLKRQK